MPYLVNIYFEVSRQIFETNHKIGRKIAVIFFLSSFYFLLKKKVDGKVLNHETIKPDLNSINL